MGLKGVRVDGVTYRFDHEFLENNPEEMPAYGSNDEGKALVVGESGQELVWTTINQLPPCLSADHDKLLSVDDEGHPQWAELDLLPHVDEWDSGMVLGVTSTREPEWTTLYGMVSDADTSDGDFLVVDNGDVVTRSVDVPDIPDHESASRGSLLCVDTGLSWMTLYDVVSDGHTDDGDSLVVENGRIVARRLIPERSDSGNVLGVDSSGELSWVTIDPLPDRDEGDVNKLLVVADTDGSLMWSSIEVIMGQIPGGGSGESVLVYSCEGLRWEAR